MKQNMMYPYSSHSENTNRRTTCCCINILNLITLMKWCQILSLAWLTIS